MSGTRLGEILQSQFGLTREQLEEGLRVQEREGRRIGSTLMALGHADPDAVANALARQKGVPAARRKHFEKTDPRTLELLPKHLAELHRAVPLGIATRDRRELIVAMRDPDDAAAIDQISYVTKLPVRPAVAPELIIDRYLGQLYGVTPGVEAVASAAAVAGAEAGSFAAAEEPLELDTSAVVGPPAIDAPADVASAVKEAAVSAASKPPPVSLESPDPGVPRADVVSEGFSLDRLMSYLRPWSGLILLVAGSLAFIYAARFVKRGPDSPGTVAVGGRYFCKHVGLSADFPHGWRYVPEENQSDVIHGTTARGAYFYSGGSADEPDQALALAVLDSKGQIPESLDEKDFRRLLSQFKGSARDRGPFQMRVYDCDVTELRGTYTGECTGGATYKEQERHLIAFLWVEPGGYLVMAGFLSVDPPEDLRDTIEEIVTSIELE